MFGWKRRRARKAAERALRDARLEEEESSETIEVENVAATEDGPEPEPARRERPIVDLLSDGERLGFEPELHIPEE